MGLSLKSIKEKDNNLVKDSHFQLIYKYRAVNKYTLESLINSELYFASPNEFNDPFDSKASVIFQGCEDDWRKFLTDSGYDENQLDFHINILKNNLGRPALQGLYGYSLPNSLFCCFSEINDNILMWSHYAHNHQGISLGFKSFIAQGV